MKKKLVEQMPAPTIRKRKEEYVGIARMPAEGLCTVDFVNTKTKQIYVRVCLTEKEWMNYYPDTGKWDYKTLRSVTQGNMQIQREIYMSPKYIDKENLFRITKGREISKYQYDITNNKISNRYAARRRQLKERCDKMPEITSEMEEWLTEDINDFHFLYYKRTKRKVTVTCSACGQTKTLWTHPVTLEEMVQPYIETPIHGHHTECPMCNANVIMRAAGRTKGVFSKTNHRYIVQRYKEEDLVIRYFDVHKEIIGKIGNAQEESHITEVARIFFMENGKVQKDFCKYNPYTGEDFWDDCNLSSLSNIQLFKGKTYGGNMEEIAQTRFKYSGVEKMVLTDQSASVIDYLQAYNKFPQLEILQKLGMISLANYIIRNIWTDLINPKGKNITEIFGITKARFNDLRTKNGDQRLLRIYQMEKQTGQHFSDEQVTFLLLIESSLKELSTVLKYTKVQKMLNYICKKAQVSVKEQNPCSQRAYRIRETFIKYADYIKACEKNGRSLTDAHELYPEDLEAAHQRELLLIDQCKNEIACKEKNIENPNIKKDAAGYNRRYRYQNKDYIIRAPKDAAEIFMEGLLLNHCVGRMGYIESMNRHETVILFLRRRGEKETPYYTLEVKDGKIRQAYGYGDEKPDWEQVKPFIDNFTREKLSDAVYETAQAV